MPRAAAKKPAAGAARKRKPNDWAALAMALPGARKATLKNEAFAPELARLGDAPPVGDDWLHELKWDGYRLVATMVKGKCRLWSRNAIEWTTKQPKIAQAIEALGVQSVALDGELIAGRGTQADFNLLQSTLSGETKGQLVLALFDLIHLDGVDVAPAPLIERKGLLEQLLAASSSKLLSYSSHIEGEGTQAFKAAAGQGFEGIISKRASAPYRPGRGDDWRKTKHLPSDEFAVVGYMAGKGGRKGVGSLLLAKPDPKHGWLYVGRVGTGFTDELLRQLDRKIGKTGDSKPTVEIPGTKGKDLRGAVWFPPMFVVEVFIRGMSNQGVLRQPSLKALRLDKDPEDLLDSDRAPAKKASKKVGKKALAATPSKAAVAKSKKAATGSSAKVAISSPDKIIFPDQGITKGQVAAYYDAVMDHLLSGIVDRPLSVIRCPGGVGSPCFFQKHHTPGLAHVDLVKLKEEKGNAANYIVVRDERALMELVQFGGLEFHPWGSTAENPDVANRVVIDLDPGPDVPFSEVKKAAIDVRDLLAQMELTTFVRTTGGKGLHVVVPLNPGCEWDLVKSFAHGFADTLATSQPKRFLSVSTLKLRPGKIFVDYLRNGRGATAVASYSLRGRAGAPVALPIAWSELKTLKAGNAFHMDEVVKRLKRRRKDPWEGIDDIEQDLSRWSG